MLVVLPENEYVRHDNLRGNGQSRLLQSVRNAILESYPRTEIRADGQVVKVLFSDGMKFEILPAFKSPSYFGQRESPYRYPDTNMGGSWCSTNPKAEQHAMSIKNKLSHGLLFDTCQHVRSIRDEYFSSYTLSGIVIDSFVYHAIGNWHWLVDGEIATSGNISYEQALLKAFNELRTLSLTAPGSNEHVACENSLECLEKILHGMITG